MELCPYFENIKYYIFALQTIYIQIPLSSTSELYDQDKTEGLLFLELLKSLVAPKNVDIFGHYQRTGYEIWKFFNLAMSAYELCQYIETAKYTNIISTLAILKIYILVVNSTSLYSVSTYSLYYYTTMLGRLSFAVHLNYFVLNYRVSMQM